MSQIIAPFHRYPKAYTVSSMLDPLDDVTNFVESLTAIDYLREVLISEHRFSKKDATSRAKLIIPHLKIALSYLEQAKSGPPDVSFLPLYYCILNLSKAYILIGPHHALLPSNRWHGAQYPVTAKDSHNLLTEFVYLHPGGTIPLLYRTLTGNIITKKRKILMSDVYPYIPDISAEFSLASKIQASLASIRFSVESNPAGQLIPCIEFQSRTSTQPVPGRNVKTFLRLSPHPSKPNFYIGASSAPGTDPFASIKANMRSYLLYPVDSEYVVPLNSSNLLLPEELPILLSFFHLSSVVRYKPEFFSQIRDSKYWPMLSAAKRHTVLKFLTLFWSYVHNTSLFIIHR